MCATGTVNIYHIREASLSIIMIVTKNLEKNTGNINIMCTSLSFWLITAEVPATHLLTPPPATSRVGAI